MLFGDEFYIKLPPSFDLEMQSKEDLHNMFHNAKCVTGFHEAADGSFSHKSSFQLGRFESFRVDSDSLIEINDSFLREAVIIRNEMADLISFQFVSTVKRSEFLGDYRNVHNLGPAIIVSVIPKRETTYRVPQVNETIRHVVINTTLSNVMERMGEDPQDYPRWLQKILSGEHDEPRQRVLFLEDVHQGLTWSLFHRPVSGQLERRWLEAKFYELLSVGMQCLKNNSAVQENPAQQPVPHSEKIRHACAILNREYAHPPSLPELSKRLGVSETQLKAGFKSFTGTTVMQYCITRRIEAAHLLLTENRHSISEIADIVGYEDHSAFSRAFRRISGCTPKQWRTAKYKEQLQAAESA